MKITSVLPGIGGILAAFLASLCCIGPVAVALLGLGGIGFASLFEPLRPYFIALTVLFLGTGFYLNYRKTDPSCGDGSCEVPSRRKWNRRFLWLGTVLVAVLILFPYLPLPRTQAACGEGTVRTQLFVEGMTCSSCDFAVEQALQKLPGVASVKADHKSGRVQVQFDPDKARLEKIKEAVDNLGYHTVGHAPIDTLRENSSREGR